MSQPPSSSPGSAAGGDAQSAPHVAATGAARQAFDRHLEPLLGNQLRRLRRRWFVHGTGFALLLPAVAIALFFALDHTLRLPVAIRLFHTLVIFGLLTWAIARHVVYPMSRRFASLDMAQAMESAFPELHQRLVSAVQLVDQKRAGGRDTGAHELRNQSAAMIDALVAETAEQTRQLPLDRFFDPRRTRRVLVAAGLAMTTLGVGVLSAPDTARAFVLRHIGMAAEYPRLTYLSVDLPPAGPELQRIDDGNVTELLLPAGGELHVSVLAEGIVPKEVFLDVTPLVFDADSGEAVAVRRRNDRSSARSIPMTPRPGDRFRYVFRKVSGAFEFHATGGDDENGDRLVRVRTIHPPQIATIRAVVHPPAYTGVETIEQNGGAVEALVGSEVELFATTTAAVQSASMVFLESGRRIELEPTTIQDDSAAATAYRTSFRVQGSDRYQIELLGGSGLRNPNPGTYPIAALEDYAPVGRWLLPTDQNTLLLPDALLCVRLEARDDFGLFGVDLSVDRGGEIVHAMALLPPAADGTAPLQKKVLTQLIELRQLLGGGHGGDGLSLGLTVSDNCQPQRGSLALPHRIVQIVDPAQLAESIAKGFRRLREEADGALDIQIDRRLRLEELAGRADVSTTETAQVLSAVEVGQSRILGSCDRLHRGLMRAFDLHLWNKLETSENAALVVELYRETSASLERPLAHDPEFYRELVTRRAAGTIGAMETALDPILQMIAIADALATTEVPRATRLLAELQIARPNGRDALVQQTLAQQQQIAVSLQQLLHRLEEWNDYQDMVQEARALRDRQRDLRIRTEEIRGNKK